MKQYKTVGSALGWLTFFGLLLSLSACNQKQKPEEYIPLFQIEPKIYIAIEDADGNNIVNEELLKDLSFKGKESPKSPSVKLCTNCGNTPLIEVDTDTPDSKKFSANTWYNLRYTVITEMRYKSQRFTLECEGLTNDTSRDKNGEPITGMYINLTARVLIVTVDGAVFTPVHDPRILVVTFILKDGKLHPKFPSQFHRKPSNDE